MRIQDLGEKIKDNIAFINAIELESLINFLKATAIDVLSFPQDKEVEAIKNITDVVIHRSKDGICKIEMHTTDMPYEDVFIELNTSYITIGQQRGHSKVETISIIPVSVLAMALVFWRHRKNHE